MGPTNPNKNDIGAVTNIIMSLDNKLYHYNESEWSNSEPGLYSAFNSAGIECEVGEFLHGFIRLIKPLSVLETGTHVGIGASYIGLALAYNGVGKLDTYEFLPELHQEAIKRLKRLFIHSDVDGPVYTHLHDVGKLDTKTMGMYDFILLDTEPQTRFAEFEKFYDNVLPGGYVFIHDLHNHMHQIENTEHGFAWPYGRIPEFMKNKVLDGEIRPFHFHTPRGLTGFYKVSPTDYRWNQ